MSSGIEDFERAKCEYELTLRACYGGGGLGYIDTAYETLRRRYFALDGEERKMVTMPEYVRNGYSAGNGVTNEGIWAAFSDVMKNDKK